MEGTGGSRLSFNREIPRAQFKDTEVALLWKDIRNGAHTCKYLVNWKN